MLAPTSGPEPQIFNRSAQARPAPPSLPHRAHGRRLEPSSR